ncbi:hypothetical protein Aduo_019909 [Ancylostoma duodenale]
MLTIFNSRLPQLYYPSAGLVNPLLGAAAAQSQGAVDYTALAAAVANGQGAGAAYAIPQAGSRFQGEYSGSSVQYFLHDRLGNPLFSKTGTFYG